MVGQFPTKEEMMRMPLKVVRGLDIRTIEQERSVQDVVNVRLMSEPLDLTIDRRDVPDITSKEQEDKWQKIIDERTAKARGMAAPKLVNAQPVVETVQAEVIDEPEPIVSKKKIGRPKKVENCEVCKQSEHLKDCPLKPSSV